MRRFAAGLVTACLLCSPFAWAQIVFPPFPYRLNPAAPSMQGLSFWWIVLPHIAGGTTWYPLVGSQAGVLTNMASSTHGFQPSTYADGLGEIRFGGTDDYLDFTAHTRFDFVNTVVTFYGRVRCTNPGVNNYLWSKRSGVSNGGYFVRIGTDGALLVRILDFENSPAAARSSTTATLCDGNWRTIAVMLKTDDTTVANNDITIYINGRLDQGSLTPGANPHAACAACRFVFGSTDDVASALIGAADDLRIWERRLSEREIMEVHNQRPPGMGGTFLLPDFGYGQAGVTVRRKVTIQ